MVGSSRWFAMLAAGLAMLAMLAGACSLDGAAPTTTTYAIDAERCTTSAECPDNASCVPSPILDVQQAIVLNCAFERCETDAECLEGLCQPTRSVPETLTDYCSPNACIPPCSADSCSAGWQCSGDGHCAIIPCTDVEFEGCPEGWYCDEATARAAAQDPDAAFEGSSEVLDQPHFRAGCKEVLCSDAQGDACAEGWVCEPELAWLGSAGCRRENCTELAGVCLVGITVCDPRAPDAGFYGCRPLNCSEGYACDSSRHCDPDDGQADAHGCAWNPPPGPCTQDVECAPHYCVEGRCSVGPGRCRSPSP